LQLFAWQANQRGNDVNVHANPTQGELLHQQFKTKKAQLQDSTKVTILSKYGGEEYLQKAPRELLQGQTEEYVEYSQTGAVVKGREKAKARSKYAEDGKCDTRSQFLLLTVFQCSSTITLQSGALGISLRRGNGVMRVATRLSTCHIVPELPGLKQTQP
jgi:hypothetical protein